MKKPSKFRLVKGNVRKKDAFLDLNVFRNADGNILAVGEEKLAVVSGSGKDVVFVLLAQDPAVRGAPKFALRSDSVVTELLWSETSSSRLATGHESGVVRVWDVASGALEQDLSAPVLELRGAHKKKVVSLAWSPVASDVLASAGGELAVVWSEAEPRFVLSHPAAVFSVAWSPDGALLLTTCADKKTRIWDPRSSVSAPVLEYSSCHDGVKPATGLFVSQDAVLTAGFNKNRERQLQLWSVKENKQLAKSTMDSGTGVLTLLFDPGSGLVFVSGKSDASIKVFETGDDRDVLQAIDGCGDPAVPLISVAQLPKRQVGVNSCEVARLYGVTTAPSVVPISFVAPRKVQKFDPELFPHKAHAGTAACSAAEWVGGFSGPANSVSLDPLLRSGSELSTKEAREAKQAEEKNFRRWNESAPAVAVAEDGEVPAFKIDVNAPEVKKFESVEYKQVQVVRSSSFRHVFGQPLAIKDHVTGLTPSRTAEGTMLAASSQYFAVPYDGPGGRLAVVPTAFVGRLPEGFSMVETGSTVADFTFANFHPDTLVTGQDNGVLIWKIPAGGLSLAKNAGNNLRTEHLKLVGHRRRVTSVVSNPTVDGILASISSPCGELKIWDLQNGSLARSMDGFDGVFGASWNYSGGLLACIGGKEGVRVVDSRKQAVVNTFPAHDLAEKTSSVVWDKDQRLVTCGFGKGSQRQVRVFDLRKPDPLQTFNLDISNGAMTMHLDVDTGVLFLAGKGDGSVQMLELTADDKCVHELTSWRSSTPQTAVCFLPKQCCDVREVEIARMLKLQADKLEPVKFIVPRQRKEYFQDDLFPPTRSSSKAALDSTAWLGGSDANPILEAICPAGMTAVSVAPPVEKEKKPSSAYFLQKADEQKGAISDAEAIKDNLFKKVTSRFKEDENAPKAGSSDVAEEEWD